LSRGAQAAERHDYLGPARERGRAELSIPLPIVVVVRGVVAALEPGYSSFVIAGENSAVIEAGEAPRHGVHFTGPSREDHTTQVTYRARLGRFVGVPLGDLVAVPARLRNNGRWHFGYPA